MTHLPSFDRLRRAAAALLALAVIPCTITATLAVQGPGGDGGSGGILPAAAPADAATHLVISEVLTGGASASDEFIEIYNPTVADADLVDLELVYVTASGATITRKASWTTDAPPVPAGAHLLLANTAGIYAAAADLTYSGGLAATGGSVALRSIGGDTAIDAVGWGTSTSTWLEGTPAPAADPGASLERLPGGASGSWQDTDDNAADFVLRSVPDPQDSSTPPVPPDTSTPTPTPTATPTPASTPTPAPTPIPALSIADARAAADGTTVTVIGTALSDAAFAEGGGYVADATGGVAVLVSDGTYARGDLLQVTGEIGDRYAQRTIRASGADIVWLGAGTPLEPIGTASGSVNESVEGVLVALEGVLLGSPTVLSGGLGFDLDDGTGAVRVFVGTDTGIDLSGWQPGASVALVGIVGQRDSSGTGTAGYRVMPRDPDDILGTDAPATPSPSPSATPSGSASPSGSPDPAPITIAAAREAEKNARVVVRGVVTLASGLVAPGSAAVSDATGSIFVRISDEAGELRAGELVELTAKRSTWTGMESLHVDLPPVRLGTGELPLPAMRATGAVGEADEATILELHGIVASSPTRSSSGNVYFDLDDGSGPARIFISPRSGIATENIGQGQSLVLRGVLLQETTGAQPTRGYRLWPRSAADVEVTASAASAGATVAGGGVPGPGDAASPRGGTAAPLRSPRNGPLPILARPRATASPPVVLPTAG